MGRKKKRAADPRSRIFCYYCERNFQTEQMLLTHQREKHLRCPTCHKKMLSVQSLTVHVSQMHNYTLQSVPNALPERSDPAVEVLGMNGVPDTYYSALDDGTSNKAARTSTEQRHPRQQASGPWPYNNSTHAFPQQLQYAYQRANGVSYPARHGSYPQYSHHQYSQAQHTYSHHPSAPPYSQYSYPTSAAYHPPTTAQPYHSPSYVRASPAQPTNPVVQQPSTQVQPRIEKVEQENKVRDVKIVFDRVDYSMEELRAQLPRYMVS